MSVELVNRIRNVFSNVNKILESIARNYNALGVAYIESNMDATKSFNASNPTFNSTNFLRINNKTGLAFSFSEQSPDSLTTFKVNNSGIKGQFGSKLIYSKVQEEGMFIKSKGNMHKFFWAKFFETKKEYYKIIALSVIKKGGINIKARPYFAPAMQELKKDGAKIIEKILAQEIEFFYQGA